MSDPLNRRRLHWVFVVLGVAALLLGLSVAVYAFRVYVSARTLIHSASQIRSADDVEREAATWLRASRGYSEFQSQNSTDRGYQMEVTSGFLSTLHLVPSTGVFVQIITSSSKFQRVVLGLYTQQSSVWVEDDSSMRGSYIQSQRDRSGTPMKTIVMLGPDTNVSTRTTAFALNAKCLVKLGGCKNATEILSAIPKLESTIQSSDTGVH